MRSITLNPPSLQWDKSYVHKLDMTVWTFTAKNHIGHKSLESFHRKLKKRNQCFFSAKGFWRHSSAIMICKTAVPGPSSRNVSKSELSSDIWASGSHQNIYPLFFRSISLLFFHVPNKIQKMMKVKCEQDYQTTLETGGGVAEGGAVCYMCCDMADATIICNPRARYGWLWWSVSLEPRLNQGVA